MLNSAWRVLRPLPAFALLFFVPACGGDDDGDPASSLSPLPALTPSPGAHGTVAPSTPTPGLAGDPAKSPAFVTYEVSRGDTLASVAATFASTAGELTALNRLEKQELVAGQLIAVPSHPDPGLLVPAKALSVALRLEAGRNPLAVYAPSPTLIDGYLGRLALKRVRMVGPDSVDGAGYILEFSFTDRPPLKGGEPDPSASFTGPAFVLGAGSLAPELLKLRGASFGAFQAEGVGYAIVTFADARLLPAQIWDSLEPVTP